jgi:hypothetical protein
MPFDQDVPAAVLRAGGRQRLGWQNTGLDLEHLAGADA